MARKKKQQEESGGNAPWMNTFADLMNLLLCFFVLLFSMSTVDAEKYEALVTSMVNKINVFPGGGSAVGEGSFVSSGTDQLFQIEDYFAEYEESGNPTDSTVTGEINEAGNAGYVPEEIPDQELMELYEKQKMEEQKQVTENLYEEVVELVDQYQLVDLVNVSMDDGYRYVQLSLKGAILFDSGKADIKKGAVKIIDKLGDLLKIYDKHRINIEGHTDDVPINNGLYKNNYWLSFARAITVFEYLTDVKKLDPRTLEATGRGEYDPISSNDTPEGRAKNRRVEIKIQNAD